MLQTTGAGDGATRLPWPTVIPAMLVALVAGGCQLLLGVAQPTLPPLTQLGDIVEAGRVDVPGSGFSITVPDGWIVEVAPGPGIVSAPPGAAWEALRAYAPDGTQTCSIYVALPPKGAIPEGGDAGVGSGTSVGEPHLRLGFGAPTFMVPEPRTESGPTLHFSAMGTHTRLAASDPGTPRDVLYALVCGADRERDFDAILGTFGFVPVPAVSPAPATSPAPARSIVPGSITNVSLGIYSGRPDPSWALSEAESAELSRLLASLPSTVGEPPQGGLGYHGFVLAPADAGRADRTLVAYRGTIDDLGSGPAASWWMSIARWSAISSIPVDRTCRRSRSKLSRPT